MTLLDPYKYEGEPPSEDEPPPDAEFWAWWAEYHGTEHRPVEKHLPGQHDQKKHGRKGLITQDIDTDLFWDSYSARLLTPQQKGQAEFAYDKFREIFPEVAEKNWIKAIWVNELSMGGTLAYVSPYWDSASDRDYEGRSDEFRRLYASGVGVNLSLMPKALRPLTPLESNTGLIQATVGHDMENPLGATMFHELAHALWYKKLGLGRLNSMDQKRLEKAIDAEVPDDVPSPSLYATTSAAEFFAEVVTAAYYHSDKYSTGAVNQWRKWISQELKRLDEQRIAAGIKKDEPFSMDPDPRKLPHPLPWVIYDDFGFGEEIEKHGNKGEPGYFLLHPGNAPKGWKPTAEDWAAYNNKTTTKKKKGKFKLDPDFYAPEPDYEDFGPVSPEQMKSLKAISDPQKYLTTSMDLLLMHQQPDDPSIKPVPPLVHTWSSGPSEPRLDEIKSHVEEYGHNGLPLKNVELEAKKVGNSWVLYLYGQQSINADMWPTEFDTGIKDEFAGLKGKNLLDGKFFHRFTTPEDDFDETDGISSIYISERIRGKTKANISKNLRDRIKKHPKWDSFQVTDDDRRYDYDRSDNYLQETSAVKRMTEDELDQYKDDLEGTWNYAVGIDDAASEKMYIKKQRENLMEIRKSLPDVLNSLEEKYPLIQEKLYAEFEQIREILAMPDFLETDGNVDFDAQLLVNQMQKIQMEVNDYSWKQKGMSATDHFVFSNALKTSHMDRGGMGDVRVAYDPFPAHLPIQEIERQVKLADLTRRYIDQWAESAGDHKTRSIAVQRRASEWSEARFGRRAGNLSSLKDFSNEPETTFYEGTSSWELAETHMQDDREFLWMFLDAQYEETQDYFRKQGIERVLLHRGMYFDEKPEWLGDERVRRNMTVKMNPLSSWSANWDTAKSFAVGGNTQMVFSDSVPVESIFATSVTGVGALNETEVVVLGYEEIDFLQWKTAGY